MNRLTKENAHLYLGKKLYSNRPILGYYPYTVRLNKLGKIACFDSVGVGIVIPDEKDLFNAIWFDFVEDDKEGGLSSA